MTATSHCPSAHEIRSSAAGIAASFEQVHRIPVTDTPLRSWADRGRHRHDVATIIACLSGRMRVDTGPRSSIDIAAGEVVIVPPGALHLHHHQRLPHTALEIGHFPSYVDVTHRSTDHAATMAMPLGGTDRLMHRIACTGDPTDRLALLRTLLRRIAAARLTPVRRPPAVQRMLERIWWQSHLPTLQVSAAMAASGLGATRSRDLFQACIGLTPKAYLTSFRLGIAHGLIDGGWGLEAAAREAGFADAAGMRRCARMIGHRLAQQDRRRRAWRRLRSGDSARNMG